MPLASNIAKCLNLLPLQSKRKLKTQFSEAYPAVPEADLGVLAAMCLRPQTRFSTIHRNVVAFRRHDRTPDHTAKVRRKTSTIDRQFGWVGDRIFTFTSIAMILLFITVPCNAIYSMIDYENLQDSLHREGIDIVT